MEIRELREGDGRSLSRLIADVQGELPEAMTFGVLPSEQIGETIAWKLRASREGAMADLVAVEKGEVVADCEILCEGGVGTVGIIIRKERRGVGIGGLLLERCIARARGLGVRTVRARIRESNALAVSFFARLNFEKVSEATDGTVLMCRALP